MESAERTDFPMGLKSEMHKKLTLHEAQQTGAIEEFVRQQEEELDSPRGSRSRVLNVIRRMAANEPEN